MLNNAGIIKGTLLKDMDVTDFKQVLDVDLVSPFIVSKQVGQGMISRKRGKIIKMLTLNMATEWAKHNIQVNGIGQ